MKGNRRTFAVLFFLISLVFLEALYLFSEGDGIDGIKEFIGNFNLSKGRPHQIQEAAQKLVDTCYTQADRWKCYQSELKKLTRQTNFLFASDTLFAGQAIDPVLRDCHVLAHLIAQEAARKNPAKWKELLLNEADIYKCGTGFLHGVIEVYIGENPNQQIDADLMHTLCSIFPDEFRNRSCVHLFAHLIVLRYQGDITPSLAECDRFKTLVEDIRFECYVGVFMEDHQKNIMVDHRLASPPIIDERYLNALEESCRSYAGKKGEACWHEMGEIYTKFYNYQDPSKVYEACYTRAPRAIEKERCYTKAIVPLTLFWDRNTPDELISVCKVYEDEPSMYDSCIHMMISTLMHYTVQYTDRAVTLCSASNIPNQAGCFSDLAGFLRRFIPALTERKPFCEKLPSSYQNLCLY